MKFPSPDEILAHKDYLYDKFGRDGAWRVLSRMYWLSDIYDLDLGLYNEQIDRKRSWNATLATWMVGVLLQYGEFRRTYEIVHTNKEEK